jgi:hypothetical protein
MHVHVVLVHAEINILDNIFAMTSPAKKRIFFKEIPFSKWRSRHPRKPEKNPGQLLVRRPSTIKGAVKASEHGENMLISKMSKQVWKA